MLNMLIAWNVLENNIVLLAYTKFGYTKNLLSSSSSSSSSSFIIITIIIIVIIIIIIIILCFSYMHFS